MISEPTTAAEPQDRVRPIAPPPVIYAGALAAWVALDWFVARLPLGLPDLPRYWGGGALVVLGLAVALIAAMGFGRAGTGARHAAGTSALVTTGAHAFSRNPMYVGMTLAYVGLALIADSALALIGLAPVLLVIQFGVIVREEAFMEAKFGDAYRAYKKRVRPWI